MRDEDGFAEFATGNARRLRHIARLLTGEDHRAEDLLQVAPARTYRRWDRISRTDDPLSYVRRILINAHATGGAGAGGTSCRPGGCRTARPPATLPATRPAARRAMPGARRRSTCPRCCRAPLPDVLPAAGAAAAPRAVRAGRSAGSLPTGPRARLHLERPPPGLPDEPAAAQEAVGPDARRYVEELERLPTKKEECITDPGPDNTYLVIVVGQGRRATLFGGRKCFSVTNGRRTVYWSSTSEIPQLGQ